MYCHLCSNQLSLTSETSTSRHTEHYARTRKTLAKQKKPCICYELLLANFSSNGSVWSTMKSSGDPTLWTTQLIHPVAKWEIGGAVLGPEENLDGVCGAEGRTDFNGTCKRKERYFKIISGYVFLLSHWLIIVLAVSTILFNTQIKKDCISKFNYRVHIFWETHAYIKSK